jgi:hypothetical protein
MIHINSSKESAFVYLKTRKAEKTIIGFINGGYWYSFFLFGCGISVNKKTFAIQKIKWKNDNQI